MSTQSASDRLEKTRQSLSSLELSLDYQYILAGVLAIFTIRYVAMSTYSFFRRKSAEDSEKGSARGNGVPNPSAFSTLYRVDQALQQPVGTRWLPGSWTWTHLILAAFIVGLNIAFCLIVAVDLITPETKFSNIARAFSRRTGRVATQNLPVLFALVGRNNPVSLMTGIGYQETRFIHKLVGVLVFVETIIHTFGYVGYYIVSLGSAQLYKEYTRFYFQMGIVATVGGFMCFAFGVHYFRRRHYEFFLVSHILGAAMYLAGTFYHRPICEDWVYAAVGFWVGERLFRFVRHFAGAAHHKLYVRTPLVKAQAQVLHGAVVLKVPYPNGGWIAGQHVYVSFWGLDVFRKSQSHPFSIVNASRTIDAKDDSPQELELVLRIKSGVTKKLADYIIKHSNSLPASALVTISMEGPYGFAPSPAEDFESVLLFAGGSGITHPASILDYLMQKVEQKLAVTSQIKLVWAIQHLDQMSWIKDQLLRSATIAQAAGIDFTIDLYVTQLPSSSENGDSPGALAYDAGTATPQSIEDGNEKKTSEDGEKWTAEKLSINLAGTKIHHGRPAVSDIMSERVRESSGRTFVVGCGPESMVDDIRRCKVELKSFPVIVDIASFEC